MKGKTRNNQKGIGLIELLLVIAVVALTTPMIFWVFLYGIQSFNTYNKYMQQQDKIIDVTQRIRQDMEEAVAYRVDYNAFVSPVSDSVLTVCLPDGTGGTDQFAIKVWRFRDGKLLFKRCTGDIVAAKAAALDGTGFSEILDGLDTDVADGDRKTRFEEFLVNRRVLLSIKPAASNAISYKNRNVNKPITTEFTVDYKDTIN